MVMSPSAVLNSDDFIEILNNGENSLKDKKTETDPFEDIIKRKIKNYIEKVKDTEINDVYKSIMGLTEKIIIEEILNLYNFNQLKVSKLLGINRNTLRKKINEYKIDIKKQV
jgi:DNA-binding protein Fis